MKSVYNESDFYYTDKIANNFRTDAVGMNSFIFKKDIGYYPNIDECIYFNDLWGILSENDWLNIGQTIQILFSVVQEIIIEDMGDAYLIKIEGVT